MEDKHAINVYRCKSCGGEVVTINADRGVTPMFTRCRADVLCGGTAVSSMYKVDQSRTPTHEWYRPTTKQMRHQDPGTRDHVKNGGLLLRRVSVYTLEQLGYGPRTA